MRFINLKILARSVVLKRRFMFSKIISILIVGGLIAFSAYQVVQIVRTIKERKKAKSIKKESENNDRN